jgi:hypothetical protein
LDKLERGVAADGMTLCSGVTSASGLVIVLSAETVGPILM